MRAECRQEAQSVHFIKLAKVTTVTTGSQIFCAKLKCENALKYSEVLKINNNKQYYFKSITFIVLRRNIYVLG